MSCFILAVAPANASCLEKKLPNHPKKKNLTLLRDPNHPLKGIYKKNSHKSMKRGSGMPMDHCTSHVHECYFQLEFAELG